VARKIALQSCSALTIFHSSSFMAVLEPLSEECAHSPPVPYIQKEYPGNAAFRVFVGPGRYFLRSSQDLIFDFIVLPSRVVWSGLGLPV
jgi:hypothetical protein